MSHPIIYESLYEASQRTNSTVCEYGLPEATDQERVIGTILSWLRYKKKSIEWTRHYSCAPSPKGHIVKGKSIWMPAPCEACACDIKIYTNTYDASAKKTKWSVHPYAWVEHCKTIGHCTYLAQRRLHYVTTLFPCFATLDIMASALVKDEVLLLSNNEYPLIQLFFKDWCEGDVTRYVPDAAQCPNV